jgi:hypothetical protein
MTTHAPPVTPPGEQAPKPVNPEPLQQQIDPEKRRSQHPPPHTHTHVPELEPEHEHPKTLA